MFFGFILRFVDFNVWEEKKNIYGIKLVYFFKFFINVIEKSLVLKRFFVIRVVLRFSKE